VDILFKREQTPGRFIDVNFKLWCKIELDEEEQSLTKRYRFDDAMLIAVLQPELMRKAVFLFLVVWFFAFIILYWMSSLGTGLFLGFLTAFGATWWFLNEKRETIFVKDLIHGRNFKCKSVIELAQKEAYLNNVVATLRQVMVGAKHWDGTEQHIRGRKQSSKKFWRLSQRMNDHRSFPI